MQLPGYKKQESAMAPLPKWKPRKTLIDLYVERDQTHWYWRLIASIPAASIMIGHVLESSETADMIALSIPYDTHPFLSSASLPALLISIIATTTYLTLVLFTFRKIYIVRKRDAMHRHNPSDSEAYHLLPEDEMQRQQLLRLLQQRENGGNNKTPRPGGSSAEVSQSTFRIDLPDSLRRMETLLTAPRSVYENRRNDTSYNSRSVNFSPLSAFSSSRRAPSPYEPLTDRSQSRDHEHEHAPSPPQLPQIPLVSPLPERTFTQSTSRSSAAAPPYTPGEVEAPIEKRGEIADLTGEVHPLEREQQQERERARP
ncbi:MAG: hypothetical protein L6R39_007694, partial [Caloplaca ligustica]